PVVAQRTPDGPFLRPRADDPDRDPRLLDRLRPESHRLESIVTALEPERFAAPEALEDGQALVEPLGADARIGRLADVAERAVIERPEADRQDQPAAGQAVERHGLARQLPWAASCPVA